MVSFGQGGERERNDDEILGQILLELGPQYIERRRVIFDSKRESIDLQRGINQARQTWNPIKKAKEQREFQLVTCNLRLEMVLLLLTPALRAQLIVSTADSTRQGAELINSIRREKGKGTAVIAVGDAVDVKDDEEEVETIDHELLIKFARVCPFPPFERSS